jgi:ribosomal-protein-alanine N-acetyltransferase
MPEIIVVTSLMELMKITDLKSLATGLHEMLIPFEDSIADIVRGIEYALDNSGNRGGFVLLAREDKNTVGALVMLRTNMGGYIPENLLLFVAVHESRRGKGLGTQLIKKAFDLCTGDVKLHVEYDNPAKKLYERIGFVSKYAEMRYSLE